MYQMGNGAGTWFSVEFDLTCKKTLRGEAANRSNEKKQLIIDIRGLCSVAHCSDGRALYNVATRALSQDRSMKTLRGQWYRQLKSGKG